MKKLKLYPRGKSISSTSSDVSDVTEKQVMRSKLKNSSSLERKPPSVKKRYPHLDKEVFKPPVSVLDREAKSKSILISD